MLTVIDAEQPRTSRGKSPRLAAAKPSNQASGELLLEYTNDIPKKNQSAG